MGRQGLQTKVMTKQSTKAIGIILSASCMTDMPAFYPQQLIDAVETRRKKGAQIHTLVIWTKHPSSLLNEPLNSYLMGLRNDGIQLYIQLTITGMGQLPMGVDYLGNPVLIEPHAPKWEDAVAALPQVMELVENPLRIRLRIDPILRFKDASRVIQSNLEYMPKIIAATAPLGIMNYSFSFVEKIYSKVLSRFGKLGLTLMPPDDDERLRMNAWLEQLCSQYGVNIYSCSVPGFPKSSCIDGALLEQLHDNHLPTSQKLQGHRALCGCTKSTDLGGWPPKACGTGCLYCYSNPRR